LAFALMAERWMGEPEWIARPPKELLAKAGRTVARVVKMVEVFIFCIGGSCRERGAVVTC